MLFSVEKLYSLTLEWIMTHFNIWVCEDKIILTKISWKVERKINPYSNYFNLF